MIKQCQTSPQLKVENSFGKRRGARSSKNNHTWRQASGVCFFSLPSNIYALCFSSIELLKGQILLCVKISHFYSAMIIVIIL